MSYMFELYDIVVGAKKRSNTTTGDLPPTEGGDQPLGELNNEINNNDGTTEKRKSIKKVTPLNLAPLSSKSTPSTSRNPSPRGGGSSGTTPRHRSPRGGATSSPRDINNNNNNENITTIIGDINNNSNDNSSDDGSSNNNNEPPKSIIISVPDTIVVDLESSTQEILGGAGGTGGNGKRVEFIEPDTSSSSSASQDGADLNESTDGNEKYEKSEGGLDDSQTIERELVEEQVLKGKVFIKPKNIFRLDYLVQSIKYHAVLFLVSLLVVVASCLYVLFYVALGNRGIFSDSWLGWERVLWFISGIVTEQLLVSIGYVVSRVQFGHKKTKVAIPFQITIHILSIVSTILIRYYDITGTLNLLPKYFLTLGGMIVVSYVIGCYSLKTKMYCFWFTFPFIILGVVLIMYDYLLLKWYLASTTSDNSRLVVRVIVHPFVTAICLLVSRVCASQLHKLGPRSSIAFIMIPLCFNTFYGRFFGSTMNSYTGVIISSLIISLVDMIWKCSLRARDAVIVRVFCRFSANAKYYISHNLPLYAEYQSYELIYELASSFIATFLICSFFFVFERDELDITFQLAVMFIQFFSSWLTEFVVTYVSLSYLKLPIIIPWNKRPNGFLFLCIYSFIVGLAYMMIRFLNILGGRWVL